jgi:hypothetical protein
MIYFDFDKSDIRIEAVWIWKKYWMYEPIPNMKLDIRSHTDIAEDHSNTMKHYQTEEQNQPLTG